MQILEAFRALNALNEDTFALDADGIKGLSDFKNNDDFEDDISIIDTEAETEEELQDNYIGKVILDCCVCHSKLYKAKEDITIDETGELANVGEECPYCFTPDGFKIIGEVTAFEGEKDTEDEEKPEDEEVSDEEKSVEEEEPKEEVEESLKEGIFGIKTKKEKEAARKRQAEIDAYNKRNEEDARLAKEWRDWCAQSQKNGEERERRERAEREARAASRRSSSSSRSSSSPSNTARAGINYSGGDYYSENLEEGVFDKFKKNTGAESYDVWCSYDGDTWKAFDKIRAKEAEIAIKDAYESNGNAKGFKAWKEPHTDSTKYQKSNNSVNESIDDLSLTANDTHIEVGEDETGKVTVTMEPVTADGGEMIAPVSDETETELMSSAAQAVSDEELPADEEVAPEGEDIDLDIDEVDEESVDELGESYFKRVYENVNSFKTSAVRQRGNSLIVEGKIKFNNGKVRRTSFVFEALDATKSGKVRFVGNNKNITEGNKAFMLTGKVAGNKLIAESLNYNYRQNKANGKSSRVYGTARTSRR